ncbi:MAG: class I SAM-dependent DNA methyltransferase [Bacillota bacterium]
MVLHSQIKQVFLKAKGKVFTIQNLASSYDKITYNYNDYFYRELAGSYEELLLLLGSTKDKKILDLGCGPGWFGKIFFDRQSPHLYHGIDISNGMIYQANKTLSNIKNVKLEKGDFTEILGQIPANHYDFVINTWSLKFNNYKYLMPRILKVLKPGGKFALLTETADSESLVNQSIQKVIENNINLIERTIPNTYLPLDSHDLTRIFNISGFSRTMVYSKSQNFTFRTMEEMVKWINFSGLLVGWDKLLDFDDSQITKDFSLLLNKNLPNNYKITKRYLGAIAQK